MDEQVEECSDCEIDMEFSLSQLEKSTGVVDWHKRLHEVLRLLSGNKDTHTNFKNTDNQVGAQFLNSRYTKLQLSLFIRIIFLFTGVEL